MKVLVTGGAGFIGSHLSEALVARGDQVIVLDDLSTGQRGNLAGLEDGPGFRFVEGSITDAALVERLLTDADLCFRERKLVQVLWKDAANISPATHVVGETAAAEA